MPIKPPYDYPPPPSTHSHTHTHTHVQTSQSLLSCKLAILILLQPGLLIIDYGHFQYNSVSLGFALWGISALITDYDLLGSVAFSLALNYKQMELYHALPFFFYLLGKSFQNQSKGDDKKSSASLFRGVFNVLKIGSVVLLTFGLLWFPFYQARGSDGVLQVFRRLFPFNRGLYEDKVANFWCSVSVIVKVRQLFSQGSLVVVSGVLTLLAALPSSVNLLWQPRPYNFLLALVSVCMCVYSMCVYVCLQYVCMCLQYVCMYVCLQYVCMCMCLQYVCMCLHFVCVFLESAHGIK